MRKDANALLEKHRVLYRFPDAKKKRSKTISAGNDSRALFSDPSLLVGLFHIFWPDMTAADTAPLAAAARDADAVRGPAAGAANKPKASTNPPSRASPEDVVLIGALPIEEDDDIAGVDSSLELDDAMDDDEMAEGLEEDEVAGNAATAIDVWLKAIKYMSALHAQFGRRRGKQPSGSTSRCFLPSSSHSARALQTPSLDQRWKRSCSRRRDAPKRERRLKPTSKSS